MGSLAHFLVLACSLLLALPPGWCCYFPGSRTPSGKACAGTDSVRSCCSKYQAHPSNQEPEPQQPFNCPCDERLSTPLEHSQACTLDLSLPSVLAPIATVPEHIANLHVGFVGDTSPLAAEPPLHLLNCLWLC